MIRCLKLFLSLAFCLALLPKPAQAAPIHDLLARGGAGGWLNVSRPLTAADMEGRLVLLDFWTYGCINCMQIVPDLEYLENTYGDKLLIIGVHSAKFAGEQGSERILAAARRFGLKHPVINDSDFGIWKAAGVRAWPTLILLGPDGAEINRYEGEGNRDAISYDVKRHLKEVSKGATPLASLAAPAIPHTILSFPARLAWAPETPWGPLLFVADSGHNRVLGVDEKGVIKVTIGNGARGLKDGAMIESEFNLPRGLAVMDGALYVADTNNHALRRVDLATGRVETVAGTGRQGFERDVKDKPALQAALASPWDIEPLADGKTLAVANAGTHQLWSYDTAAKTVSVLAGTGTEDVQDGKAIRASLAQPSGLSLAGDTLFFVDAETSSLRELTPDGKIKTLIGTGLFDFGLVDGKYPAARMQHAQGLYADKVQVVVADTYNNVLRVYDRKTKTLRTLTREGGLEEPGDVLAANGRVYVADTNHNALKTVDLKTGALADFPLSGEQIPYGNDALTAP